MTNTRNGMNGNVKHLLWVGAAIAVCVTVSWFMDHEVRAWDTECHQAIEKKIDLQYETLREDLREIKQDVKEIRAKVFEKR